MQQAGLFGLSEHLKRLSEHGDPLEILEATVEFEHFRGWGASIPYNLITAAPSFSPSPSTPRAFRRAEGPLPRWHGPAGTSKNCPDLDQSSNQAAFSTESDPSGHWHDQARYVGSRCCNCWKLLAGGCRMRTEETAEVTRVMEDYIRGTREGDAELLRRIFHREAMVAGWFGDDLLLRSPEGFIARAASTQAGPHYNACVASVSVLGKTATATLYEDGLWNGLSFVNQFHLIRDEANRWTIIAKLFHRD